MNANWILCRDTVAFYKRVSIIWLAFADERHDCIRCSQCGYKKRIAIVFWTNFACFMFIQTSALKRWKHCLHEILWVAAKVYFRLLKTHLSANYCTPKQLWKVSDRKWRIYGLYRMYFMNLNTIKFQLLAYSDNKTLSCIIRAIDIKEETYNTTSTMIWAAVLILY